MKIEKRINMDKKIPSFTEMLEETRQHQVDVRNMMLIVANVMQIRALKHDWTKIEYAEDFYDDIVKRNTTKTQYIDRNWAKIHTSQERHHLNTIVQDDVNLVDVIEFICDCICSGYARDGEINPTLINLDDETLRLAFNNTIKKLDAEVEK
ncbi:MAG: hypothetical protein IKR04_02230 [Clostridia bacterium]|nr:hypothetical protein [Clostridia bacterium]